LGDFKSVNTPQRDNSTAAFAAKRNNACVNQQDLTPEIELKAWRFYAGPRIISWQKRLRPPRDWPRLLTMAAEQVVRSGSIRGSPVGKRQIRESKVVAGRRG
jgi:hypothetical protein